MCKIQLMKLFLTAQVTLRVLFTTPVTTVIEVRSVPKLKICDITNYTNSLDLERF